MRIIFHPRTAALCLTMALATVTGMVAANAGSVEFDASGGTGTASPPPGDVRSASAVFDNSSGDLKLTLTNSATWMAESPTDVLTAIVFNFAGNPTLSPVAADITPNSKIVSNVPNPATNPAPYGVGGEWALSNNLASNPYNAKYGVSSTGLGLFGQANFPGSNLQGPTAVDGPQYGIATAGGVDPNSSAVKQFAFIDNAVVFDLGAYSGPLNNTTISNLTFIYGTSIGDAQIGGTPHVSTLPPAVPEPPFIQAAALLLMGGIYAFRLRRSRKPGSPHGEMLLA